MNPSATLSAAPLSAVRLRRFGADELLRARVQEALEKAALPRLAERFAAEALALEGEALGALIARYVRLEPSSPRRPHWRRSRRWWLSRPEALGRAWWDLATERLVPVTAAIMVSGGLLALLKPSRYLAEASWRGCASALWLALHAAALGFHTWAAWRGRRRRVRRFRARVDWAARRLP